MNKFDKQYEMFLEQYDETRILEEGFETVVGKVKSLLTGDKEFKNAVANIGKYNDVEKLKKVLDDFSTNKKKALDIKYINQSEKKLKLFIDAIKARIKELEGKTQEEDPYMGALDSAKKASDEGEKEAKTLKRPDDE